MGTKISPPNIRDIVSDVCCANHILSKLGAEISEDVNYDYRLPKLTVSQYKELAPYLKVIFYEVVEVEGE